MSLFDLPTLAQQSAVGDDATILPGQWRLARVELINWGTFPGHTVIDVARKGHLLTGASGSGKSSLLDAIGTVLTPGKWLKFNAAAQDAGARGDDRTLVSYVRGAWKKEADVVEDRAVASYLRTGATWSGILLVFDNGQGDRVTLARLFHLRAGSDDKANLKTAAFADRGDVSLSAFAPFVESGIDARKIKANWPSATVTTASHGDYFVRLGKLLGIPSDNALLLLHKTQSAKNLSSLDHLFRSFMLDYPATFQRAANAVEQFTELNDAHGLVVDARNQLEALSGLDPHITVYERATAAAASAERLSALIDVFERRLLLEVGEEELQDARTRRPRLDSAAQMAGDESTAAFEAVRIADLRVNQLGGGEAEAARDRLERALDDERRVAGDWQRLADDLDRVGLAAPTTVDEFGELSEAARRELSTTGAEASSAVHAGAEHSDYFEAKREVERLDAEITELAHRKSNLPAPLLFARKRLADGLGVAESALPFAGELIEVSPAHADWTGAIERVLAPLAVTMLVRDEHLAALRRLVDSSHLGARLRFEAVPAIASSPRPAGDERSLLNRVTVSPSPFTDWLRWRLADQYDTACVEHPDDLDGVERGVTRAGQVKSGKRRYEKNDVDRIDDRTKWMLGADNRAKLAALKARRNEVADRLALADAVLTKMQAERDAVLRRRAVLDRLAGMEWLRIDREAAARAVAQRREEYEALSSVTAELADAAASQQAAHERQRRALDAQIEAKSELGSLDRAIAELESEIERLTVATAGTSIHADDELDLRARYRSTQRLLDRASVPAVGRQVAAALSREQNERQREAGNARSRFEELAHTFRTRWEASAADLTASIEDRDGYRALRAEIESKGLPKHEQRFLQLLREKSRELIAYLLRDIREAPKLIRERIDPVNESLSRSQFDRDRFLKIRVKEQRSGEVDRFLDDLKRITEGSWEDESLGRAEERFAVLEGVMRRLGSNTNEDASWRQRVLDTREHVTFQAQELDRWGEVVNVHDSSAGLSGGQRQKLVIFCLAAALRYQLTRDDIETPAYATIVLDEAFDKADAAFTRMALDVFQEFGFHLLLATPQKLLTTIEPYVGAITSISNETRDHSRVANVVIEDAARARAASAASPASPAEDIASATDEDNDAA